MFGLGKKQAFGFAMRAAGETTFERPPKPTVQFKIEERPGDDYDEPERVKVLKRPPKKRLPGERLLKQLERQRRREAITNRLDDLALSD